MGPRLCPHRWERPLNPRGFQKVPFNDTMYELSKELELFRRLVDSSRETKMVTEIRWQKSNQELTSSESKQQRNDLFLRLARENEAVMLRVALRLCNWNRDLAEECVQEAIVSAYRSFDANQIQEISQFRPWILRILTNVYLKECRRNRHMISVGDFETLCEAMPAPFEKPNELTFEPKIEQALAMLSPDQRMCVDLIDINDLEYSETAKILGIPIGTVRSRLARARLKMAELIATYDMENPTNV